MAWDSTRPVPWRRLIREWLIYAGIMAAVFVVYSVYSGNVSLIGAMVGLVISGPLYLLFGSVLAKFGYQRKSMKQLRAERTDRVDGVDGRATSTVTGQPRQRPAPTRRTSGGGGPSKRPGNRRR
jgi:hypothetical protein